MKKIEKLKFKSISITVVFMSSIGILSANSTFAQNSSFPQAQKPGISQTVKLTTKPSINPKNEVKPGEGEQSTAGEDPSLSVTTTVPVQDPTVPTKRKTESSSSNNIIDFIALFLSTLNTVGLGILLFLNKKANENISQAHKGVKSLDSRLIDGIKSLKSSNQVIEDRITRVDKDNQKSLSDIKRKAEELQQTVAGILQKPSHSPSTARNITRERNEHYPLSSDRYSSDPINNQPLYISRYNDRHQNFQDNYQLISVEREAENYKLSRSAQTEDVILDKHNQGDYWLFSDNGRNFVVPKHTFKIRENDLNDAKALFECINYREDNYINFVLVEPALVIQQGNGTWQLKDKGKLQFG